MCRVFGDWSAEGMTVTTRGPVPAPVEESAPMEDGTPGFTTSDLLTQIQEFMKEQKCDPEQFKGRIIFMSMFNDIVWGE